MTAELTPVAIEAKLRQLVNDLARAQAALRQARDLEVDARHAYDRARRRAILSDKSPTGTPSSIRAVFRGHDLFEDPVHQEPRSFFEAATRLLVRPFADHHHDHNAALIGRPGLERLDLPAEQASRLTAR